MTNDNTTAFKPNQRVTDCEGNRATFLRLIPLRNTPPINVERDGGQSAIVRYVGDSTEYACPVRDLTAGWK